jgi:hypothetical protein
MAILPKLPLARFKQSLTVVGRNLSKSSLIQVQAAVNYLWVGRWMADRDFVFPGRVPDRNDVFVSIARRVADKKVLYLEFGVAAGETIARGIRWWSSAAQKSRIDADLYCMDSTALKDCPRHPDRPGRRASLARSSTMPFLLWHFSPGDKIENCSAQFLAVCWIVHVEFKVHRLRDGFSVSNALLLGQSLPAFIGHNLDKIGDGTVL